MKSVGRKIVGGRAEQSDGKTSAGGIGGVRRGRVGGERRHGTSVKRRASRGASGACVVRCAGKGFVDSVERAALGVPNKVVIPNKIVKSSSTRGWTCCPCPGRRSQSMDFVSVGRSVLPIRTREKKKVLKTKTHKHGFGNEWSD